MGREGKGGYTRDVHMLLHACMRIYLLDITAGLGVDGKVAFHVRYARASRSECLAWIRVSEGLSHKFSFSPTSISTGAIDFLEMMHIGAGLVAVQMLLECGRDPHIKMSRPQTTVFGPRFACKKRERSHRVRDFKEHNFNSIPPTSQ